MSCSVIVESCDAGGLGLLKLQPTAKVPLTGTLCSIGSVSVRRRVETCSSNFIGFACPLFMFYTPRPSICSSLLPQGKAGKFSSSFLSWIRERTCSVSASQRRLSCILRLRSGNHDEKLLRQRFRSKCNLYPVNEVLYLCWIKPIQRYHCKFRSDRDLVLSQFPRKLRQ